MVSWGPLVFIIHHLLFEFQTSAHITLLKIEFKKQRTGLGDWSEK